MPRQALQAALILMIEAVRRETLMKTPGDEEVAYTMIDPKDQALQRWNAKLQS